MRRRPSWGLPARSLLAPLPRRPPGLGVRNAPPLGPAPGPSIARRFRSAGRSIEAVPSRGSATSARQSRGSASPRPNLGALPTPRAPLRPLPLQGPPKPRPQAVRELLPEPLSKGPDRRRVRIRRVAHQPEDPTVSARCLQRATRKEARPRSIPEPRPPQGRRGGRRSRARIGEFEAAPIRPLHPQALRGLRRPLLVHGPGKKLQRPAVDRNQPDGHCATPAREHTRLS